MQPARKTGVAFIPVVSRTDDGVPYLTEPGVVVLSRPHVDLGAVREFLAGFERGLDAYLEDPSPLDPGAALTKFAGQLCYMSFGEKRTWNADAAKYFENLMSSGHGSVFEHAHTSLLLYGVSRAATHEVVRHRTFSYSQVSTRFVSADVMRFVERYEFSRNEYLHASFIARIDRTAREYRDLAEELSRIQAEGSPLLTGTGKSASRKRVRQLARMLLTHEVEAPLVMTGNVRSWRHFIEMRASEHADTEMRILAFRIFEVMRSLEPLFFEDYEVVGLDDGTHCVRTGYRKV
jgi:thymidylate synthase (FAD)